MFADDTGRRVIGGKLIRRLAADRLLVSSGMADSQFVPSGSSPWYGAGEGLTAVGPRAQVLWQRGLGGQPAPITTQSASLGSAGFLLADNRLFWTAWDSYDGTQHVYNVWLDLTTGAVLPVPVKKQLEGTCKPVR